MENAKEYDKYQLRLVHPGDVVSYKCRQCGRCCQNAGGQIMLESLDAYRLGQLLRKHGDPVQTTLDVYEKYTEPLELTRGYPIFTLKTAGASRSCIFLKEGKCSVYPARPRPCRLYPFTVAPNPSKKKFSLLLCLEAPFHFSGGEVHVGEWMHRSFPPEDRHFVLEETEQSREIVLLLRQFEEHFLMAALKEIVIHHYGYSLDKPFRPQYERNMGGLKKALNRLLLDQAGKYLEENT